MVKTRILYLLYAHATRCFTNLPKDQITQYFIKEYATQKVWLCTYMTRKPGAASFIAQRYYMRIHKTRARSTNKRTKIYKGAHRKHMAG